MGVRARCGRLATSEHVNGYENVEKTSKSEIYHKIVIMTLRGGLSMGTHPIKDILYAQINDFLKPIRN